MLVASCTSTYVPRPTDQNGFFMEYKFGTAGVRVPRIEDIDRAQKESGIMEAIQALAETLQISNGEAIELIMREEANVPDYA